MTDIGKSTRKRKRSTAFSAGDDDDTENKTCTACDETKPLSDYSKSLQTRDGWCYQCKECMRKSKKAWIASKKEKWHPLLDTLERSKTPIRRCRRCKETKAISAFASKKPLGIKWQCNECLNEMARTRRSKKRAKGHTTPTEKACVTCTKIKPIDQFGKLAMSDDGHMKVCKKCLESKDIEQRAKTPTKECSHCNETKSIDAFGSTLAEGINSICKICSNTKQAIYLKERFEAKGHKTVDNKKCAICKETKSIENFYKHQLSADGHHNACKPCALAKETAVYQAKRVILQESREKQEGSKCATCKRTCTEFEMDFAHFKRGTKYHTAKGKPLTIALLSIKSMHKELPLGRWLCIWCHVKETADENKERMSKNQVATRKYLENPKQKRKREFVQQEKLKRAQCADCKAPVPDDPVLQRLFHFDHLERANKVSSIANMVAGAHELEAIKHELKKCQLLCIPCHRRKTKAEKDWMRAKGIAKPSFRFTHRPDCDGKYVVDGTRAHCPKCRASSSELPLWLVKAHAPERAR